MNNPIEPSVSKKVAVIGSGCSGIAALWALKGTNHDVYLYEADGRLGGHTNTVQWKAGKYSVDVDTGFIVLNTATYPNFINFLKHLNITTEPTSMALGVSRDYGSFEWAGKSLASVFCQTKNLFSLKMWRMLFDIVRFNQFALDVLINADIDAGNGGTETIGEYLDKHGYSHAFRDGYLIPITAAVWSTSPDKCIHQFPTLTLIRFLWNHHNLSTISAQPEWLTLKDGSRSYIDAVMKDFPSDHVFLNSPVQRVENNASGRVVLYLEDGRTDTFNHVILATHGGQALSILGSSAKDEERSILSCFKTSQNEVLLHSDLTHMPQRRNAWCSWNYMTLSPKSEAYTDTVSLTYNMNILQHIPENKFGHILVTLNPLHRPDPALTQGRYLYSHPLYTSKAVRAQKQLPCIQNVRGISYAGAWTNYGFHEDGFSSGLRVAQDHLGVRLPFDLVDSTFSRGKKPELGIVDYLLRFVIILVQVLVVQTLELLAGVKRRPEGKQMLEGVKQR
ncbi:NAD/FAD-binding-like protein [Mollisia scopiformis]|uniref:NAD/FAD-binding-like protein n=1 Tax=Mollisia scopiformis TaxID=149040 RepID=A0A132BBL9_MOLSC|nr:NAD/FAD-binding-like protein [Mollisia scopiformis]KUJ09822.1 NAD/FAD-binding-like protein [Mollisia scopiformis]